MFVVFCFKLNLILFRMRAHAVKARHVKLGQVVMPMRVTVKNLTLSVKVSVVGVHSRTDSPIALYIRVTVKNWTSSESMSTFQSSLYKLYW